MYLSAILGTVPSSDFWSTKMFRQQAQGNSTQNYSFLHVVFLTALLRILESCVILLLWFFFFFFSSCMLFQVLFVPSFRRSEITGLICLIRMYSWVLFFFLYPRIGVVVWSKKKSLVFSQSFSPVLAGKMLEIPAHTEKPQEELVQLLLCSLILSLTHIQSVRLRHLLWTIMKERVRFPPQPWSWPSLRLWHDLDLNAERNSNNFSTVVIKSPTSLHASRW